MFAVPITENKVKCVIKTVKGIFSVGCDEIPEYVGEPGRGLIYQRL
jgi:hypothetical protein